MKLLQFVLSLIKTVFEGLAETVTWQHVIDIWKRCRRLEAVDDRDRFEDFYARYPLYSSRKRQLDDLLEKMERSSAHVVELFGPDKIGKKVFAAHLYQKMRHHTHFKPFLISIDSSQEIYRCFDGMFGKPVGRKRLSKYLKTHPCFIVLEHAEFTMADPEQYSILQNSINEKNCKSRLILLHNKKPDSCVVPREARTVATQRFQTVQYTLKGLNAETDKEFFLEQFTQAVPNEAFFKWFFDGSDGYPEVMEAAIERLKHLSDSQLNEILKGNSFQNWYGKSCGEPDRSVIDILSDEEREVLQYLVLRSPRTEAELTSLLRDAGENVGEVFWRLESYFFVDKQEENIYIRNTIRHQMYLDMIRSGVLSVKNKRMQDMDRYLLYEACAEQEPGEARNTKILDDVIRRLEQERINRNELKKRLRTMLEKAGGEEPVNKYKYAVTNALNLLIHTEGDLNGLNLSGMPVGAVNFEGIELKNADLRGADVRKARFSELLDRLTCCAFHPNGRYFVTGGVDGKLIFWSNETMRKIEHIEAHESTVWDIEFSEDGKHLASCGDDGSFQIWNIEDIEKEDVWKKSEVKTTPSLGSWLTCLSWHGNEIMVAGGDSSGEGRIYCYDFEKREIKSIHRMGEETYHSICFSPDGSFLLAGTSKGKLQMLRPDNKRNRWKRVQNIAVERGEITSIVFTETDGSEFLTGGDDGTLRKWNRQEDKLTLEWEKTGHRKMITGIQTADNGNLIISAGHDGAVITWTKSGQIQDIKRLQGCPSNPDNPAKIHGISTLERQILACSADASIRMWDVYSGREKFIQGSSPWCNGIALYGNGTYVTVACADAAVRRWNLETAKLKKSVLRNRTEGVSIAVSPDEKILAIGCGNGRIEFRNLNERVTVISGRVHEGTVRSLAFLPGKYCLISASNDGRVLCHNLQWKNSKIVTQGQPQVLSKKFPRWLGALGVNLEQGLLAYTMYGGKFQICKIVNEGIEPQNVLQADDSPYQTVAFSPDGKWFAAAGDSGKMFIWQMENEDRRVCQISRFHVSAISFSPDSRFIAAGDSRGILRLISADSLEIVGEKKISGHALFSVKFADNDPTIYAAGEAGNVIVCSIEEQADGIVDIVEESILRRSNIYAGMKIREEKEKGMPRILIESLKCQGAVEELRWEDET